jgi:hypothetical protein
LEVVLQPGDLLFIPALWAHHTEALRGSPSVAVNVFWRELHSGAYPRKDLYGNADPVLASEALKLVETAGKKLASLPRDHKVFYGGLAASRLLRDLRVERDVASTVAAFAVSRDAPRNGSDRRETEETRPFASRGDTSIDVQGTRLGIQGKVPGVFAPPACWTDAAKGVAVGIGIGLALRRILGER